MMLRAMRWTLAFAGAALVVGCFDLKMPDRAAADCFEGITDACWQRISPQETMDWSGAVDYCDSMGLGGLDWRLPTIDELRSLVRGCAATVTGGACGVTEDCLYGSCMNTECNGCGAGGGPGYGGCYWDSGLQGLCSFYWTSSSLSDNSMSAWAVTFDGAYVNSNDKTYGLYVRCVADMP
jgi:formylglycine-generating enzyme required for sulfatase activity